MKEDLKRTSLQQDSKYWKTTGNRISQAKGKPDIRIKLRNL